MQSSTDAGNSGSFNPCMGEKELGGAGTEPLEQGCSLSFVRRAPARRKPVPAVRDGALFIAFSFVKVLLLLSCPTSTGASLVLHQSTGNSACTLGEQLLKGLSEITNKGCECSRVGRGSLTSLPCVRAGSSRGSGEKGPLSPLPPLGMCLPHGGLTPLRVTADNQKQTTSPTHPQKPAHGHEALRSPHWCV